MRKNAFLFPGQGSQYPGMAKDFYDAFQSAKQTFEEADELLSMHLSRLIFNGPQEELTLTKNSQIAIYVVSMAILRVFQTQFPELIAHVSAGLSLGEYSALTASGKIEFSDCLHLVKARASYMNEACEKTKGTMHVVLGLEAEIVEELLKKINPPHQVWIANLNCPNQVVIAGTLEGVEVAGLILKEKGAKRVLPLEVSGAFHSGLMQEAQKKLERHINSVPLLNTASSIVMNVAGDYVENLDDIRRLLIEQITKPVKWEAGIRSMIKAGIECYIEIGCGKTLQGMNKKIGVSAPTFSIEKISDLEGFAHATFKK